MPTKKTRAPVQERSEPSKPRICDAPDCGRPAYARGLCQTHHRQLLIGGKVKPIRPYRKRSEGTVKFAGLRLTLDCAGKIQHKADREGISKGAAIAEILEGWLRHRRTRRAARRPQPPLES